MLPVDYSAGTANALASWVVTSFVVTAPEPPSRGGLPPSWLFSDKSTSGDSARTLMHYEMRLDRQLTRTYKLLKTLQLTEKARTAPIPFESRITID